MSEESKTRQRMTLATANSRLVMENVSLELALAAAQAELAALKRGEFICRKCGLRKDGEGPSADF